MNRKEESHPSFGTITVNRHSATPGVHLFDSSIRHSEYISLSIMSATRTRDLHHDYIFPREEHIEIAMSRAQWGEFVSSFGQGSGTPCTLTRIAGERIPAAAHESRLAVTANEVAPAAAKSTAEVQAAVQAVAEGFAAKAGRVEMGKLLRTLEAVSGNLPSNMRFAANSLTKHAEAVVTKAKGDIEAMHLRAAENADRQIDARHAEFDAAPKELPAVSDAHL